VTNQHYKRLEDGAMDEIDAAVWSGDMFHNRANIAAMREMMSRSKEAWDNFQVLAGLTGVNLDRKYQ
jgi:hypothetical protein